MNDSLVTTETTFICQLLMGILLIVFLFVLFWDIKTLLAVFSEARIIESFLNYLVPVTYKSPLT